MNNKKNRHKAPKIKNGNPEGGHDSTKNRAEMRQSISYETSFVLLQNKYRIS